MAITPTEGFLLKLMEFDESRPFMEAKCKWLLFEFSAIQMTCGTAEVPVPMRSSTLDLRVLKLLDWKWHTYFQWLLCLSERNKLLNTSWLLLFFLSQLLGPDLPEHFVEASHTTLSEIPAWHLKLLLVPQQTTIILSHIFWRETPSCITCSIWYSFRLFT